MSSLRRFLLVSVLSALMLVNFIAALHGYRSSMVEAENLFDQKLTAMAVQLSSVPLRTTNNAPAPDDENMVFQLFNQDGKLVWHSVHAPDQYIAANEGFSENNFNGYRWRTLSYFNFVNGHRIMIAERVDLRYQLAESVILESIVPVVLVLPVAGLLIWLIIGHGLKSLAILAGILRRKAADDLSAVDVGQAPGELMPVIDSVNSLLRRLTASFERERRFSADAAHELRTPISAIKMHLHNLRDEYGKDNESLLSLDQDVDRLAHLVEQMLLLHRTTPDHYPAKFESVALAALTREIVADRYADFVGKGQSIEIFGDDGEVNGDRFALGILIQNLLNNAFKYTQQGGAIQVKIDTLGNSIRLMVVDNGPGISADAQARVFERFYRVGGDRHNSGVSGCGLGLSIVEHIAELHNARIFMANGENGCGLAVTVEFPLMTPAITLKQSLALGGFGERK
ncbi:ATP-binding protein [Zhongshania sp.]|uniref:ATP-binding protein n=1 Tax=Zhongshania sp. TaxID=1971902 RepID=UPI001B507F62|nr:ATP-binding protein [Zhongshania sp.]MBQ0759036.1 two-component sensor histidine kinase [Zhongshania sp.]MBQ0794970.1 two-component sensor histidine kinase [Zhongshania sp.]